MLKFQRNLKGDQLLADEALEQSLKDFRSSAHAWSEAVYNRPHMPVKIYSASWRVTAGWALGCVLATGSLAGGFYEHRHVKERARIAADEAARQQQIEAEQRKQNDDLLAKIDHDVSREVPSAMEPLAQLMAEDMTEDAGQ